MLLESSMDLLHLRKDFMAPSHPLAAEKVDTKAEVQAPRLDSERMHEIIRTTYS